MSHSARGTYRHGGSKSTTTIQEVWEGTKRVEETSSEVELFFVWKSSKKYVGNVWDGEGRVPTFEVNVRDEHGVEHAERTGGSDKRC